MINSLKIEVKAAVSDKAASEAEKNELIQKFNKLKKAIRGVD